LLILNDSYQEARMSLKRYCLLFLLLSTQAFGSLTSVKQRLYQKAACSQMDEILIFQDSRTLFHYRSEPNLERSFSLDEISQSLISLSFMLMKEEGLIPCLDLSLSRLIPEWKWKNSNLTLRHLLNGSAKPYDTWKILNKASCKISSQNMQQFLNEKLFLPLNINSGGWTYDEMSSECPKIFLTALDLIKIGQALIDEGSCCAKPLLSKQNRKELFSANQTSNPFFGLQWELEYYDIACWWDDELLHSYRKAEVNSTLLNTLQNLQGRMLHFGGVIHNENLMTLRGTDPIYSLGSYEGLELLVKEMRAKNVPFSRFKAGKVKSAIARSSNGSLWVIMPELKLVGVCLKNSCQLSQALPFNDATTLMSELAAEYFYY